MDKKNLQSIFIENMNKILPLLDYKMLDQSCNSEDIAYACEVLRKLHDTFVESYGTEYLDSSYEFVELPAIIRGRNTGHIGLGVVSLDLQSSGEHEGTFFLTPIGVIDHGYEQMPKEHVRYLKDNYIPYDYWYTVTLDCDYHVSFENVPEKVSDILDACQPDWPELTMK